MVHIVAPIDARIMAICHAIQRAGGKALVVGGYVRDMLLQIPSKDVDIEVYCMSLTQLEEVLSAFGEVMTVGRAFGVLRVRGIDVDFSLPRRDSKVGTGHKGFVVVCDPDLDFASAARRRDVTINSMGWDPISNTLYDPHGGQADLLQHKRLRATDPTHFGEDPLRGLRVAQFYARFDMTPDATLVALCSQLDLSELSRERIYGELRKLMLKSRTPSLGFTFLRTTGLLRFFPALEAMVGVPQDVRYHPEGDVWTHTMMVLDEAAAARHAEETHPTGVFADHADPMAFMLAALCHDIGKPMTTSVEADGRIRSLSHDTVGARIAADFLDMLGVPNDVHMRVCALVEHHLAPALLTSQNASPKAYRRLARKLGDAHVTMVLLEKLARVDHLGRTTEEALARTWRKGDLFLQQVHALDIKHIAPADVVQGRHLIARGLQPGPAFADILHACRELQDEHGWSDVDQILNTALAGHHQP